MGMLFENIEEIGPVRFIAQVDVPGDRLSIPLLKTGQAVSGNLSHNPAGCVNGKDPGPILSCQEEKGSVEVVVKTP